RGVADHALRDISTPGLELRLHEDEGLPARSGKTQYRRKRLRHADERDVADDEIGRERELGERTSVHTLEHGHARVRAKSRMQLVVHHVYREHALRTRLQA